MSADGHGLANALRPCPRAVTDPGCIGYPDAPRPDLRHERTMAATLMIRADGTIEDANPDALHLLGVSLAQLRALPAGAFQPEPPDTEADAAFRAQWEAGGRPDIGGDATLRRLDGSKVRVRFAISMLDGWPLLRGPRAHARLHQGPGEHLHRRPHPVRMARRRAAPHRGRARHRRGAGHRGRDRAASDALPGALPPLTVRWDRDVCQTPSTLLRGRVDGRGVRPSPVHVPSRPSRLR